MRLKHFVFAILLSLPILSFGQINTDTISFISGTSAIGELESIDHQSILFKQFGDNESTVVPLRQVNELNRKGIRTNSFITYKQGIYKGGEKLARKDVPAYLEVYPDVQYDFKKGVKKRKTGIIVLGAGAGAATVLFIAGAKTSISENIITGGGVSSDAQSNKGATAAGYIVLGVSGIVGISLIAKGGNIQKNAISDYNKNVLFPERSELQGRAYSQTFKSNGLVLNF